MKIKMYAFAVKYENGRTTEIGIRAYDCDGRRDDCFDDESEPRVKFTFELEIDPAALFPPEPEAVAGPVEPEA